ncbi:hypothetical protein [Paracoccus tibetensis]|uniref:Uncharacterized protein n=1 Tax=Paracoccus tibetensis TaxID=336292 RepID=A0A1G5DII3_9RHOB|nr:hypothetical protein [Paracoccus tibetensis]SCY14361.1 hypothetical protein SAMN05660710_00817 [Paracoccus tibetensis]
MPDRPLFLERASFHRRRLGDAARVLPVLATLLLLLPVWWVPRSVSYAGGAVWFFALWAGLIVAIWALHRALLRAEAATVRASEAAAAQVAPRDGLAGRRPSGEAERGPDAL